MCSETAQGSHYRDVPGWAQSVGSGGTCPLWEPLSSSVRSLRSGSLPVRATVLADLCEFRVRRDLELWSRTSCAADRSQPPPGPVQGHTRLSPGSWGASSCCTACDLWPSGVPAESPLLEVGWLVYSLRSRVRRL